jgi:amino acid adenylation domain-containing protein
VQTPSLLKDLLPECFSYGGFARFMTASVDIGIGSVVDVFAAIAAKHPDAAAIVANQETFSYAKLEERSRVLAQQLQELGVKRGSVVGIGTAPGAWPFVAILGVLRAGAAYLPVPEGYPPDRLRAMLDRAGVLQVLGSWPGTGDGMATHDIATLAGHPVSGASALPQPGPEDPAYVMFTSGSTGEPKAVVVPHRAVVRLVVGQDFMRLGPGTRILQAAPRAFDAATLEIWGALLTGGTLVLPPDGPLTLRGLGETLRQQRIDTLWLTAGLFHALADERPEDFAPLSQLVTGGDVVSPARVARVLEKCPGLTVINGYGPTENTTFTCTHKVTAEDLASGRPLPIGRPISGTGVHVLDHDLMPVAEGEEGELCASGAGLALGYLGRPDLTAERFVEAPFAPGLRLYRTGDLVRWSGGVLEFLGRIDTQVKLRGHRVELSGVEAAMEACDGVRQAVAVVRDGADGADRMLVGYHVGGDETALSAHLAATLPGYSRPARLVALKEIPLNANGKVDRRALGLLPLPPKAAPVTSPARTGGRIAAELDAELAQLLGVAGPLPQETSFFDLGASSLMVVRLHERMQRVLGFDFPVTDFFRHGTIASLSRHLSGAATVAEPVRPGANASPIAIVAMAGRFPGAPSVDAFWQALTEGRELISHFAPEELDRPLADGEVPARGVLDRSEWFDAPHFGLTPREANLLDPQHRVLLELAQEALDAAGHDPDRFPGRIGIFAGASQSSYLLNNIAGAPGVARSLAAGYPVGDAAITFGNDKDFLCTRIAYKLNLRGPSVTVQAACATSLLAVAQGCEALRSGAADMVLAGGVSVTFPARRGYAYAVEGMASADGHCRTFDADATGTVFGDGAGLVVLRRLDEALADGDRVIAVIRGWAVNNDGADKAGYAAPSVGAQAAVIKAAQASAGVSPAEIGYVEAHGTGTALGDPIEVAALAEAFEGGREVWLGTAKTNVGHLDIAAGVTGLIKAALTVQKGQVTPLLHFQRPNPRINFAATPLRPVTELTKWGGQAPRRAGVSAFGVGGTNVHMVLEQAPEPAPETDKPPAPHSGRAVIPVSASSPEGLAALGAALNGWADAHPDAQPAEVAAAMAARRRHRYRGVLVAGSMAELAAAPLARGESGPAAPLTFLFPGQGAQHPGMGQALYATAPAYRAALDQCTDVLAPELGLALRDLLHDPDHARTAGRLRATSLAQPAIFAVSYALARQWDDWGIRPDRMVGHSVGELCAATLAGVFPLEDALRLVALRGRLMDDLPRGAMLSVRASEEALAPHLGEGIDLAGVNGAAACVLAGPSEAIAALADRLQADGIITRPLNTSHAFHSHMMEPAVAPFRAALAKVPLAAPALPIISTVTGDPLTEAEATDPGYWAAHMRRPVRFHAALQRLWGEGRGLMLEVGPGRTLATLANQDPARRTVALASQPHADAQDDADRAMREAFGLLWANGHAVDFARLQPMQRRASGLPSYPFQRKRHWVEPWVGDVVDMPGSAETPSDAPAEAGPDTATALRALLADLSGYAPAELAGDVGFLALGFDSLMLTQAAREISRRFGLEISLRELIDGFGNIDAVVAHVDKHAPARTPSAIPAPTPMAAPVSAPITQISRETLTVTPRHLEHIERLTTRFTAKTARSKALTAQHRRHYADPRTASGFNRLWKETVYQIVTNRSKGSRLIDVDGNEYVDILNGFGPGFLGHGLVPVNEAIARQLEAGFEIGPQSQIAMEAADLFCALTGAERASFVCTGSEAVSAAMRLARTVTGRDKIVLFARDYHGNFDEVLVRASASGATLPIAPGIPREAVGNVIVLPYGTPEALDYIRTHAGSLAAVLVEPVQSRRPEFRPVEFIHELRRITETHGALLIFDEVVTGFRMGLTGAQGLFGVQADLATYGKVVGGGMPVGVVAGRAAFMDTFDGGAWDYGDASFPQAPVTFFAGTFVRHPLAMAATKAMLEVLRDAPPLLWQSLAAKGDRLAGQVDSWFRANDMPFAMPHCGSLMYLRIDSSQPLAPLIGTHLRDRGVFMLEGFPSYVTAAHDDEDIDHVVAAILDSAEEMRADGLIGQSEGPPHAPRVGAAPTRLSLPDGEERILRAMAAPLPPLDRPITEAQHEIWSAVAQNPSVATAYNEGVSLTLEGPIDSAALVTAVSETLERHDAFRTTFATDGLGMRVTPRGRLDITRHDLSAMSDQQKTAALAEVLRNEAETPFDLARGPLVRARVITETPTRHHLVLTAHHIICDGWSIGVVLTEIAALYGGRRLPPPESILDFARAEDAWNASAEAAKSHAFWIKALANLPAVLDIPADKPRRADRERRAGRLDMLLGQDLTRRLRAFAREAGVTLAAVLLAGWRVQVARAAGVSDLALGVPAAGQPARGLPGVVGHCSNLMPVRCRIDWQAGFAAQAKAEQSALFAAKEHQFFTFGALVRDLRLPRDPARIPLIPVIFNVDPPLDPATLGFEGVSARLTTLPRSREHFELALNAAPTSDGDLALELSFAADLFETETARAQLLGYIAVLEAGCTAPKAPLATATEVPAAWLALGIGPTAPIPEGETIWTLFEAQANRHGDKLALIEGDERMTAAELKAAAEALAARLAARGVGPGARVGLCLDRSARAIVALLAILRLGAAWVPLDPTNPDARLRFIADDSGADLIVTTAALVDRIGLPAERAFDVDAADGATAPLPPVQRDENAIAYVAYTSGSTGQPKGVMGPHRPMLNRFAWMWRAYPFEPGEVMVQKTALSFIDAVWEVFGPLLAGVPLVVIPPETVRDPAASIRILARHGVTRLVVVPSLLDAMLETVPDLGAALPKLRLLFVSGERLTARLARRFAQAAPHMRLINLYGSSEVAADVTVHEVGDDIGESVPIGRPLDNTRLYVLDDLRRPVPPGRPGRLFVGGAALAAGYLGSRERTAERFLPDPFDTTPGATMFDTGDRVRFDAEGSLHILGRADEQIALRGFRIEPGEVEAALSSSAEVGDAVVVATGPEDDQSVVAYVTASGNGPSPDPRKLRGILAGQLPGYMVPSRIIVIPAMPLNPNGKTDRMALASLPLPTTDAGQIAEPPATPLERDLSALWARLMGLSTVGRHDNFFELGGHSLMAVKVMAHLRRSRGLELPIATLLAHPTVAQLASHVEGLTETSVEDWDSLAPLSSGPDGTTARPLFVVGGVGGNVNNLYDLGRAFDSLRPLIGLQTRGVAGHAPRDSIAEMAADHVRDIRRHQPDGPYLIAGYSGGAFTAHEIARQLEEAGEEVGFVGIIDMYAPGSPPIRRRKAPMLEGGASGLWKRAWPRLRNFLTPEAVLRLMEPFALDHSRQIRLGRHWMKAAQVHRPGQTSGAICLYLSSDGTKDPETVAAIVQGWEELARGGVKVRWVGGDHLSMLHAPHTHDLSKALAADLREASL